MICDVILVGNLVLHLNFLEVQLLIILIIKAQKIFRKLSFGSIKFGREPTLIIILHYTIMLKVFLIYNTIPSIIPSEKNCPGMAAKKESSQSLIPSFDVNSIAARAFCIERNGW